MSSKNVLAVLFQDIADAIRGKTGDTATLKPAEFPEQISNIKNSNVLDNADVTLDFSNGDQTVTLPEGYSVNSATIFKPENLTPENIVEGVEIAGIVGAHECECDHTILETVEISPNFANGDYTENLPDGYYAHGAKVLKPDTLVAENIAEGVTIAGITGTHSGGSGGDTEKTAVYNSGNVTWNGAELSISHGLKVVPDLIIIAAKVEDISTKYVICIRALSTAYKTKLGISQGNNVFQTDGSSMKDVSCAIDSTSGSWVSYYSEVYKGNTSTFSISKGSMATFKTGTKLQWEAFGNLV